MNRHLLLLFTISFLTRSACADESNTSPFFFWIKFSSSHYEMTLRNQFSWNDSIISTVNLRNENWFGFSPCISFRILNGNIINERFTISFVNLPNLTFKTLYDGEITYKPSSLDFSIDSRINIFPLLDIGGLLGLSYLLDGHKIDAIYYTNTNNVGFWLGYDLNFIFPFYPNMSIAYSEKHNFFRRPSFSNTELNYSVLGAKSLAPDRSLCISFSFSNQRHYSFRHQVVGLPKFRHQHHKSNSVLNVSPKRFKSLSKQIISRIKDPSTHDIWDSHDDSLLQDLVNSHYLFDSKESAKYDSSYLYLKMALLNKWSSIFYYNLDSYNSEDLLSKYYFFTKYCCGDLSNISDTIFKVNSILTTFKNRYNDSLGKIKDSLEIIKENKMKIEADKIANLQQEAYKIINKRDTGDSLAIIGKIEESLIFYQEYLKSYINAESNLQSYIDTSGILTLIAKSYYKLGNIYLNSNKYPSAIKCFQISSNYKYADSDTKLLYCNILFRQKTSFHTSIKFKGFYIGMNVSEALNLISTRYSDIFGGIEFKQNEMNFKIITSSKTEFLFDSSALLTGFYWSAEIVNKMFNVADLDAVEFGKEFVNNYGIPYMTPKQDNSILTSTILQYWEYISNDGVRLRIYGPGVSTIFGFPITLKGKDISLEKVAAKKYHKFD